MDSIDLMLSADKAPQIAFLEELPIFLGNVNTFYINGIPYVRGNFRNVNVTITPDKIWVRGSPGYCLKGLNYEGVTPAEVKQYIELLSDTFMLPFHLSEPKRADFGTSITLDYPINEYLKCLGESPYYKRNEWANGRYYVRPGKVMAFYEKNVERECKKGFIPEEYIGKNVMKYEHRLKRNLPKQLNMQSIMASDLYGDLYYKLVDIWHSEYQSIRKLRKLQMKEGQNPHIKDLLSFILLDGIQARGGEAEVLEFIEDARKLGVYSNNMQIKRLKDKIKSVCSQPKFTEYSDVITELDQKIREKVEYFKSI